MKENQKNHVKKGDKVKVISGNQKGFLGIITSVIKKKSSVILEGILPRIKTIKNSQIKQSEEAKKIEIPTLIHISNVMLWDKKSNEPSRIGYKKISSNENNNQLKKIEKKRYFKKSGNFVEN
jgi:large subunit ribosomal protein L24